MRQGSPTGRRPRGRHHGGPGAGPSGGASAPVPNGNMGGGPMGGSMGQGGRPRSAASLRHQTFDSNGPDVRVRGNAWQVYEKYLSLARDATSAGDRVGAENYQQHAEHYFRIIEAINEATAVEQRVRGPAPQPFGQQPEMPQGYFAPDGSLAAGAPQPSMTPPPQGMGSQPVTGQQPEPSQGDGPQPGNEAQVEPRHPQPSPFFQPDEIEDEAGTPEPLVARQG